MKKEDIFELNQKFIKKLMKLFKKTIDGISQKKSNQNPIILIADLISLLTALLGLITAIIKAIG